MLNSMHSIALAVMLSRWVSVTFLYCVKTAKDTAIVAMECKWEIISMLSNGTIFSDLE